ncbi:hypothetical protein, partial [Mesorhizobium sp. M7A.F.Ca.MR.362.00.0.0]|uniref:hypothetical protein n=1 Tax=Mesorhizobium sp. M7A.F.Ca.MR.362.00.0.0 TaxID=2496779 RepID=UPI0019D4C405
RLAPEVDPVIRRSTRCRILDDVGHVTQRFQSDRIVPKRFSQLARRLRPYAQKHCDAAPTGRTHQ